MQIATLQEQISHVSDEKMCKEVYFFWRLSLCMVSQFRIVIDFEILIPGPLLFLRLSCMCFVVGKLLGECLCGRKSNAKF